MKHLKYFVTLIAALFITNTVNANEVKMAKANWDTGYFQAEIYKQAFSILCCCSSRRSRLMGKRMVWNS